MTTKQFCTRYDITEDQFYGREKIGGWLDLSSLTSIPEGFNPTVGGGLCLSSLTKGKATKRDIPDGYIFDWGKYCLVDGIFTEVVARKPKLWKVKKIGAKDISYLATDGAGKWAHGETIKEAKADLIYKIGSRDKSRYEGMTLETKMSYGDIIECYRVITGACAQGTKGFIEATGIESRDYTIGEVIKLTKGQYGADTFASFFGRE